MKKSISALFSLALLFACATCTPEDKNDGENGGSQNDPEELAITGEALVVTDCYATLTGHANLPYEPGDAEVGILYDEKQSFENAQKVVAIGLDGNNEFTVNATGLKSGTTYYYKSYVQNGTVVKYGAVKSFTTKESTVPDGAVDLGIVMTREDGTTYKLYWAKSNLSESGLCANPEDYGDYYAWGETAPYYTEGHSQERICDSWIDDKTGYDWPSYKWCKGSSTTLTKYNTDSFRGTVDNKTVLEPDDDVAHVKLGGKWRMPTDEEWTALHEQCTWTTITQNDIYGKIVTAPNGNSIFLPPTGHRLYIYRDGAGSEGSYWSSSLKTVSPYCAWYMDITEAPLIRRSGGRYFGRAVRPVSE